MSKIGVMAAGADAQPSDFANGPPTFAPSNFASSGFSGEVAAPPQPRDTWVWLLGRDPKVRRVLLRTLTGNLTYLMGLVLIAYCVRTGVIPALHGQLLAGGIVATLGALYAALRSGWTLRFNDPAISLAQILVAMTWMAVNYGMTGAAHAAQLPMLALTMAVAVFNLDLRGARISCAYGIASMTVSMALMSRLQPEVFVPKAVFFHWVIVASGLPTLALMGVQLTRQRMRMKTERAELRQALTRLKELATHDELTGLRNRAHMTDMLEHYMHRHQRKGEIFTVALIDLDHFKQVNDTHGHGVGDEVLQAFAHMACKTLREVDLIARWGGEEFLVLCPQSTPDQAMIGMERLRSALAATPVSAGVPALRASFSAGLATPRSGEPIEAALARADAALYAAKHAGRNRACVDPSCAR